MAEDATARESRPRPVVIALGGTALLLVGLAIVSPLAYRTASLRRRIERNRRIVELTAERLGLEPALLAAVAWAESGFDDRAVSEKGAVGLLQVMPETGREVAERLGLEGFDLADPVDNALVGGTYLKEQLGRYGGDEHLALAAYHAGPGNADAWKAKEKGLRGSELVKRYGFESTRKYVERVLRKREESRARGRTESDDGGGEADVPVPGRGF